MRNFLLSVICFYILVSGVFGQIRRFDADTQFTRFNEDWIEFRKKAKRKIAPDDLVKDHYSVFLKGEKTGILRLLDPNNCDSDIAIYPSTKYQKYEKLLKDCPQKFIVGKASSYSFRAEDYSSKNKADVEINKGLMFSTGLLNQTLFTDLGNVDLQSTSLASKGLSYLTEFTPKTLDKEAIEQSELLKKGVSIDGSIYRNFIILYENHTYVLRSIAYRGEVMMSLEPDSGYEYDILRDDVRKDVTIAFRVIKVESDKSIIILWKELDRKDSPKMKFSK